MDKHGSEWAMADVEAYDELIQRGLVPRWEDAQRFHDRWYQVEPTVVMAWYISRHFWRDHWGSLPDLKALRGPLFNADYPGGTGTARDIYAGAGAETGRGWAPYGGRTPDVWQYTDRATVPGASDRTDCNAFRGSRAALVAMLTGMTRGDDILPLSDDDAEVLIWRVEALINNRPTVIGNSVATGQPNAFAQALANLAATVTAIASKVDIDPAELEAIKQSATAGVLAAVPAITDAIVARLPADAIPRGEVEQAVRDAVASETSAVPKQALGP
jgi:hypothetical protein